MELSEIIGVDAVRAPLKATSKKRLLQDLADMAEAVYGLPSATVYKALMDREALGPTGVGRGVAIPHARFAGVEHVHRALRAAGEAGRLRVDRPAAGRSRLRALRARRRPGAEHLKALARVSRTLRSEAVCAKLRSTFDPSALYAILTDGKAEQAA